MKRSRISTKYDDSNSDAEELVNLKKSKPGNNLQNGKEIENYAVIRFYLSGNNSATSIIDVRKILHFDLSINKFPYDGYVANGLDENGEIMYEPAAILAVSNDKTKLENSKKRWINPNKRKSTVVHELAEKALKIQSSELEKCNSEEKIINKSIPRRNNEPIITPSPLHEASDKMKTKIDAMIKNTLVLPTINDDSCKKMSTPQSTPISTNKSQRISQQLFMEFNMATPQNSTLQGYSPMNSFMSNVTDDKVLSSTGHNTIFQPVKSSKIITPSRAFYNSDKSGLISSTVDNNRTITDSDWRSSMGTSSHSSSRKYLKKASNNISCSKEKRKKTAQSDASTPSSHSSLNGINTKFSAYSQKTTTKNAPALADNYSVNDRSTTDVEENYNTPRVASKSRSLGKVGTSKCSSPSLQKTTTENVLVNASIEKTRTPRGKKNSYSKHDSAKKILVSSSRVRRDNKVKEKSRNNSTNEKNPGGRSLPLVSPALADNYSVNDRSTTDVEENYNTPRVASKSRSLGKVGTSKCSSPSLQKTTTENVLVNASIEKTRTPRGKKNSYSKHDSAKKILVSSSRVRRDNKVKEKSRNNSTNEKNPGGRSLPLVSPALTDNYSVNDRSTTDVEENYNTQNDSLTPSSRNQQKKIKEHKKSNLKMKNRKGNKTKKNKKKESKEKKRLYDSEDYAKSPSEKRRRLEKYETLKTDEEGHQREEVMFHIHYGISVPYRAWKKSLKSQSSSRFLRELVQHIWPEHEFIRRAVQVDQVRDIKNRAPLTPKKAEALRRGYIQYLLQKREIKKEVNTKQEKKKRDLRINKFGRELGIIISQKRTKWFNDNNSESETEYDDDSDLPR